MDQAMWVEMARSLSDEDRYSVSGCVRAFFTLLEIYGMRWLPTTQRSFDRTVLAWSAGASQSKDWMKFVKYKFASFFFHSTDQHGRPPVSPVRVDSLFVDNPRIIASGSVGRYVDRLVSSKKTRDTFLASLLQVKKGCPRPSKKMVNDSVVATITALCTEHVPEPNGFIHKWGDIPERSTLDTFLCRASVIRELRRTVREIYSGRKYSNRDRFRHIFPSVSASVCDTRKNGGAFRSIRKFAASAGLCEETDGKNLPKSRVISTM
jgi:hypothetical protein